MVHFVVVQVLRKRAGPNPVLWENSTSYWLASSLRAGATVTGRPGHTAEPVLTPLGVLSVNLVDLQREEGRLHMAIEVLEYAVPGHQRRFDALKLEYTKQPLQASLRVACARSRITLGLLYYKWGQAYYDQRSYEKAWQQFNLALTFIYERPSPSSVNPSVHGTNCWKEDTRGHPSSGNRPCAWASVLDVVGYAGSKNRSFFFVDATLKAEDLAVELLAKTFMFRASSFKRLVVPLLPPPLPFF